MVCVGQVGHHFKSIVYDPYMSMVWYMIGW